MSGAFYPPMNYAAVEADLYRSAMPTAMNYPFIRSLGVKTFLVLSPESATEEFIDFIDSCGSRAVFVENRIPGSSSRRDTCNVNTPIGGGGSSSSNSTMGGSYPMSKSGPSIAASMAGIALPPSSSSSTNADAATAPIVEDMVTQALSVLVDQNNYPVYVSCTYGKLLVGVVVACLRKLQRWNLVSIFEEFRRFSRARYLEQEQFIELYDTDLISLTSQAPLFLRKAYRLGTTAAMRQSSSREQMAPAVTTTTTTSSTNTPTPSGPSASSAGLSYSTASSLLGSHSTSDAQLSNLVPKDDSEGVLV